MIYEFFRNFGIITGYPAQWLIFTRKTYYEDRAVQGRRFRGGALIISNHFNMLDFICNVFVVYPRKLYVVASEMAFRNAVFRFGMRFWGGIQANRVTRSMRFVDQSADLIRKGKLVQIYPEGRNTPDGKIHPFKPSYIAIALRAHAPIIPIVSDGNYGLFKRTHVLIGKPIDVFSYLESEQYTREDIYRLNEIVFQKVLELRADLDRRIAEDRGTKRKERV